MGSLGKVTTVQHLVMVVVHDSTYWLPSYKALDSWHSLGSNLSPSKEMALLALFQENPGPLKRLGLFYFLTVYYCFYCLSYTQILHNIN